jgi:protein SCO1
MNFRRESPERRAKRRLGVPFLYLYLAFGRLAFGALPSSALTGQYASAFTRGIAFEQRIGEQLPLDTPLRDESGRMVLLRDYFGQGPVVLVFGYSRCPQLCSVVANAAVETLRDVRASVGKDYVVVYVSIDPTDSSHELAALKRRDAGRYGRSGSMNGWHYLGGNASAVERLAHHAGFYYSYDDRTKLYAHASGFLIVTPDGRVSRYFLGVDFNPKDVAAAIERAAQGKTGESVYALLLICAHGLGITGKYGRLIWAALEVAVGLTVAVVFGGIAWMLYRERTRTIATAPRDDARKPWLAPRAHEQSAEEPLP